MLYILVSNKFGNQKYYRLASLSTRFRISNHHCPVLYKLCIFVIFLNSLLNIYRFGNKIIIRTPVVYNKAKL